MSTLDLQHISKTYPDGTVAVRSVDLSVAHGEFVVLLGPSGCGKTTTLRMVAGLEQASSGRILLDGKDVTALRPAERDIGFVFQFYALYPHLCVEDNIAFPLASAGISSADQRAQVRQVAERLGITALLRQRPRELSGGDQQRVALARAMVRRPALYLMDEPLGTLDAEKRMELRELVRAQQLKLGVTTIYVTHDQEEAMSLADRIVVMRGGEILQQGSPLAIYRQPRSLFVARFVGSPGMNLIPGNTVQKEDQCVFFAQGSEHSLALPGKASVGKAVLGFRPEEVELDANGPIRAVVVMSEFVGDSRLCHLDSSIGRVVVRVSARTALTRGTALRFCLVPEGVRLFDPVHEGLVA